MGTLAMTDVDKHPNNTGSPLPVDIEETSSLSVEHPANGSLHFQSKIGLDNHEEDETLVSKRQTDANSISRNKRPRINVDDRQPSVHIVYNFLPRESQVKLEELLQLWTQWHSQNCSSSNDSNVILQSGDKTYFPALRIGSEKPSNVTFWVDNQTKIESSEEFIQLDSASVPLYDRGYSLALTSAEDSSKLNGGVEVLNSSRCFNCGSYGHSLKDCRKPRDNVAVTNARKQHKSTRNQHANSRNSFRYYQSSRGGKYDGLAPGVLSVDARCALGLKDLDPPPWLNRMREIGYPPGYLDSDVDDQLSGITIFGENDESEKRGEILNASSTKPSRKMTVEFPGINGPVPENADQRLWAPPSSRICQPKENSFRKFYSKSSENQSRCEYNRSFENQSRRQYPRHQRQLEYNHSFGNQSWWHYPERKWLNDLEDDGPPGCDPRASPSLSNHFRRFDDRDFGDDILSPCASPSVLWGSSRRSPISDWHTRYGNYDYAASPRPWSPSYGRSYSDRGERSPLAHDGFLNNRWCDGYRTLPY